MGVLLYQSLAKYYDKIYDFKDYQKETVYLRKLIRKYKQSKGDRLLDIACGTGQHLKQFRPYFDCYGMDSSKEMLAIARKRNPGIRFYKRDMLDFDFKPKFDVVTCLFSSIGHLRTLANTRRAIQNISKQLVPGGVLLVEPFLQPDQIQDGYPHITVYQDEDLIIARISHTRVRKRIAVLEFQYAISERKKGLGSYEEQIEMALIKKEEWRSMVGRAGLEPFFLEEGMAERGILIGVKKLK